MGGKVSKQDHVIEQRFNYLKSMASDVSDFINNYEGDEGQVSIRKIPGFTESIRLDKSITKLPLKSNLKKRSSIAVRDADPASLAEFNKESSQDFEFYANKNNRAFIKKTSGKLQLSLVGDYMNFNLDPLTPTTFMKQARTRMDEEIRGTLQGLIKRSNTALSSTKVYLYSEIPLEDEKTMEEKSCKVVDRSINQGFEDYESPFARHNFDGGDEGYDRYENSKLKLYEMGIAVACRKGEAADLPNQDNYFVYVDAYTKVYTVYDGHGPFGNLVSHFVCIHFAKALLEEPIYLIDPVGAIKQALVKAEAALLAHTQKKDTPFDVHLSGTCATIVVQRSNMLYIAQLGDSKVMIGRKNKNKKGMSLEQLTYDHVPYSLEEKKRIYTKGGEVRIWNGDGEERVFVKGRVYPCLATTRSIGDEIGSLIGIISEPEISTVELNSATDVFLLIGSSAMFTYLDDNEILNVMNYANASKIRETADILVKKAKNSWVQNENNIEDMTLIISYI